jgi:hypothetical protein
VYRSCCPLFFLEKYICSFIHSYEDLTSLPTEELRNKRLILLVKKKSFSCLERDVNEVSYLSFLTQSFLTGSNMLIVQSRERLK